PAPAATVSPPAASRTLVLSRCRTGAPAATVSEIRGALSPTLVLSQCQTLAAALVSSTTALSPIVLEGRSLRQTPAAMASKTTALSLTLELSQCRTPVAPA